MTNQAYLVGGPLHGIVKWYVPEKPWVVEFPVPEFKRIEFKRYDPNRVPDMHVVKTCHYILAQKEVLIGTEIMNVYTYRD